MSGKRLIKKEDSEIIEVIKDLVKLCDELEEKNRYLEKENEELKSRINDLKQSVYNLYRKNDYEIKDFDNILREHGVEYGKYGWEKKRKWY